MMQFFACCTLTLFLCCLIPASAQLDVLKSYVNTKDPNFEWQNTGVVFTDPLFKAYVLNMTSLQWMNESVVTPSIWTHYMVVIVPNELNVTDTASIWITGNDRSYIPSSLEDVDLLIASAIAVGNHMITAAFFGCPNFPAVFAHDPEQRSMGEDEVVFYSWKLFMDLYSYDNNPEYNVFFPATKASVRGIDVLQAFLPTIKQIVPKDIFVLGASKRGWATWLVGAIDERVKAIVPIVMDNFDTPAMMQQHWREYGNWSYVIEPLIDFNVTCMLGSLALTALSTIMDIKYYQDALTMPKLVIDAGGDEFFILDDDHSWWGTLPGDTYRLILPNADHTTETKILEEIDSVNAFLRSVLKHIQRPILTWTLASDGSSIQVITNYTTAPTKAHLWQVTNAWRGHRDFRLARGKVPYRTCDKPYNSLGPGCWQDNIWSKKQLKPSNIVKHTYDAESERQGLVTTTISTTYSATVRAPGKDGYWNAYLIELYFAPDEDVGGPEYRFTTQANIIPTTLPYEACSGEACRGAII